MARNAHRGRTQAGHEARVDAGATSHQLRSKTKAAAVALAEQGVNFDVDQPFLDRLEGPPP